MGRASQLGGIHHPGRMAVTAVENPARKRWSLTQEALDGLMSANTKKASGLDTLKGLFKKK